MRADLIHLNAEIERLTLERDAARGAALEEAAVECERISLDSKRNGCGSDSAAEQGCADSIRALAKEPRDA